MSLKQKKQLLPLQTIITANKQVLNLEPQLDVIQEGNKIMPVSQWPEGDININYADGTKEIYTVQPGTSWDIDSNLSGKQSLTKQDIISEFLKYGILNEFDYSLIFGNLPEKLGELRARLLQALALPDERFTTDSQKAFSCRVIRGYLAACRLADVLGLTSYRRSQNIGARRGDYILPYISIVAESNIAYIVDYTDIWSELLDLCEVELLNNKFSKDLLDSTSNLISSAGKYRNIARAIVLLFSAGMFIKE